MLDGVRQRIAAWEPELGAIIRAVEVRATGHGTLNGLAAGVKDIIAVAGEPRECGAPGIVEEAPQPAHAPVVARLLESGATVVARTATHQFAYGIVTPQTLNPLAPDRIAGGSSGGTAAALAAGIIDIGLGTDTGGSIRIPASCCGIAGLKTTRGLIPLTGVHPLAWSLDTVGPMARTVRETALALEAIVGADPDDPYSDPTPLEPARRPPWRIGVPAQVLQAQMDDEVRSKWQRVLDALTSDSIDGATAQQIDIPLLEQADRMSGRVLVAEAAALHAATLAQHSAALWPEVRTRLERGSRLPASTLAEALHEAARLRAEIKKVFTRVDVIVTPTLPCVAPLRAVAPLRVPSTGDECVPVGGNPVPLTLAMTRLTSPWNLIGVPAGSVPAGTDRGGAPVGVQVVGPWRGERTVLAVMAAIERLTEGTRSPRTGI